MLSVVDPEIERYAEAHTTPPTPQLQALAAETERRLEIPQMMVGPLEGRFLEMLVFAKSPKQVLEIGTFSGYSALSMAAGLPPEGRITTCEINPSAAEVARRFIDDRPYRHQIEIRLGPALETIETLPGPFDLVFIDADKVSYTAYYEAVLPKLAPRGLIAADNTLWRGQVMDEQVTDDDTVALRAFNERVRSDPRVVCVQLTVRDGVTLIRRA